MFALGWGETRFDVLLANHEAKRRYPEVTITSSPITGGAEVSRSEACLQCGKEGGILRFGQGDQNV